MSDYYEYVVHCEFPLALSSQILETLRYMVRTEEYAFETQLEHPLFEKEAFSDGSEYEPWRQILQSAPGGLSQSDPSRDSGYFARFFQIGRSSTPSADSAYMLDFRLEVHEDDEREVWDLLQWLATISTSRGFVGYSLRHAHDLPEHPTLWYFENHRLVSRRVDRFSPLW